MNLISPLWFALRVYRQIRGQDGVGSIINISSGTGHPAGSPTLVSYGAAKAGLNQLTRSLADGVGAACPRQRPGAGPDDDRQLPVVRAAQG
jgi:NAD(P)-dependent dehydrogenase (short-subunit alcohol dehydrogenase family)